jgi:predicted enzyme related to lactoylglutathione lyase
MPDPVVRWQIVSPDAERTSTFYRDLFGWDFTQANAMGYRELRTGSMPTEPVDGGVWPSPPGQGPMCQLFIAVEDVQACVTKAEALGAKVIVPYSVLPDGDAMAVLMDPTGLPFGVCKLKK